MTRIKGRYGRYFSFDSGLDTKGNKTFYKTVSMLEICVIAGCGYGGIRSTF